MSEASQKTVADAEERAAKLGRVVRFPTARELFVDIDDAEAYARCNALLDDFGEELGVRHVTHTPSPSGREGRYHVVITLDHEVRDERERVALQAMFGSDPKRELLSWIRLDDGDCEPRSISVFFENPPTKKRARPR